MAANKPQRRHHYVPEFYLKRWQLGGDRFLEFSRPIPHCADVRWRRVSPKQTGYMDKLYYLAHLPENLRNRFEEHFFTPVDTKASIVLDRLETGACDLDSAQRSSWARFLMSLTFRAPETIQAVRRELERDIFNPSLESQRQYESRRQPDQPPTLREALELERNEDDLDHIALQVASQLVDNRKLGERLINMEWGLRQMPAIAPALLTSDRPLFWAFGVDDPEFQIVLPIGPKWLFWIARTPFVIATLKATDGCDLVKFVNDYVTRRAVDYVWGTSPRQHSFVNRYMGVNPEQTLTDALFERRRAMVLQREAYRG